MSLLKASALMTLGLPVLALTGCIVISKPNYVLSSGYNPNIAGAVSIPSQQTNFPPPKDYVPLDKINITKNFDVTEVDANTIESQLKKCVPSFGLNKTTSPLLTKNLSNANATSIFAQMSSANRFVIRGTKSTCIPFSAARYPIYPADMINGTDNPSGVAPEILEAWNTEIARLLATKGVANIAYVFNNGNANLTRYWVNQNDTTLYYANTMKMAGSWEKDSYDDKFTGDFTSFKTVAVSGQSRKMPLAVVLPQ